MFLSLMAFEKKASSLLNFKDKVTNIQYGHHFQANNGFYRVNRNYNELFSNNFLLKVIDGSTDAEIIYAS